MAPSEQVAAVGSEDIDPQSPPVGSQQDIDVRPTPLPRAQLLAVYLIQFSEPITALCIYPFINQFVRDTGVTGGDERRTGYYAGMIESTFFFSECLTVVQWGYISDRFGRRPVLLLAPLGLTLAMLLFGSSTHFWSLVVFRCFQGIFNGNIGVSKSVLAELTDSTNRADAFAAIPLVWSVGTTTAPIIGGALSNPEKQFPESLGRISYLKEHPYFLPCAVAGAIAFLTFAYAFFALKETLPSLVQKSRQKPDSAICDEADLLLNGSDSVQYGTVAPSNDSPLGKTSSNDSKPGFKSILTRPLLIIYANNIALTFIDMCYFVLIPLMYSTSIPNGGIGLDAFQIGTAMGIFGFLNAIVQLNTLSRLMRYLGPRRLYIRAFTVYILGFAIFPIMKYFVQKSGKVDGYVVVCIVLQLSTQMLSYAAYGSIQVILVENVPDGGPMATANGIAQMLSSGMRTIAPTFASSLFSVSLTRHLMGGNLVFYLLLFLTLGGMRLSHYLPDGKNKGDSRPTNR